MCAMSDRLGRIMAPSFSAWRLVADERGQALRHYVLAVILAAVLVILVGTLLAEPLYRGFIQLFGP
jgi:hypothetical protein